MNSNKIRQLLICCGLYLTLLTGLRIAFPQHILRVKLENKDVSLPWVAKNVPQEYDFVAEMIGDNSCLHVRTDDYLDWVKLNGSINWTTNDGNGLQCAYFQLPLRQCLKNGTNILTFHVRDIGGLAGFDIKEAHYSFAHFMVAAFIGFVSFYGAFKAGCSPWISWPVALAALLVVQYLDVTTPYVRQHDVDGHREYIDYILKSRELPPVKEGWETWQPPLYYMIAAAWRRVFTDEQNTDPFRSVQVLATCFYLGAVICALMGAYRIGLRKIELFATVFLFAFLPGHLFLAARINNDVILPIMGLAITLIVFDYVRYGPQRIPVFLALLLVAVLATKTSSIAIVCGSIFAIGITDLYKGRPLKEVLSRAYLVALPSILWMAYWITRNYNQTGECMYVNANLPDNMRIVTSYLTRFLSFDLNSFVADKYYYDLSISKSFPSALLASVLFGEYNLSEFGFQQGILYRAGFLGLLIPFGAAFLSKPRQELRSAWIACLALAVPQMFLVIFYAIQYPYSCNQNIRFAAQAYFPLAILMGIGLDKLVKSKYQLFNLYIVIVCVAFVVGIVDLYKHLLF